MARSGPLLTEAQWQKIAPLLPQSPQGPTLRYGKPTDLVFASRRTPGRTPKGLRHRTPSKQVLVPHYPRTRRNIKGRPFWSRVWVFASIPAERNAPNG